MANKKPIRYAVEQRYRFIDFLLSQYGHVNRSALMDYYGISVVSASADLAGYEELVPGQMTYNVRTKRYEVTPEFKRYYP